ncbi:MAG TPA: hypothetical protein VJB66_02725 [Candidatus Nanoarchaeia archaeon]|nr:hypothetical protein [Candidatus Nanoarchaeia archaeon]
MKNGTHLPQGPTRAMKKATLRELVLATAQHFNEITDDFGDAFRSAAREYGLHEIEGSEEPVERILDLFKERGYLRHEHGTSRFTQEGMTYADSYLGTDYGRKIQTGIKPFVEIVRTRHRTYPQ